MIVLFYDILVVLNQLHSKKSMKKASEPGTFWRESEALTNFLSFTYRKIISDHNPIIQVKNIKPYDSYITRIAGFYSWTYM